MMRKKVRIMNNKANYYTDQYEPEGGDDEEEEDYNEEEDEEGRAV